MVRFARFRKFWAQQSGSALTEGLLVFPIMVLAVSATVEFGFLLHQWNQGAKAMQLGVRKLIVSDPVTPDFYTVFAFDPSSTGDLINADAVLRAYKLPFLQGLNADPCPFCLIPDLRCLIYDPAKVL